MLSEPVEVGQDFQTKTGLLSTNNAHWYQWDPMKARHCWLYNAIMHPKDTDGMTNNVDSDQMGRVAQSVGHLTRKSGVLGSIPGLATYFRFSFRFFKKGSCQLLAKVCARSTG